METVSKLGIATIAPLLIMAIAPIMNQALVGGAQAQTIAQAATADQLLQQGNEQFQAGQVEQALQSWQRAQTLYRQEQNPQGEGAALLNLGSACVVDERYRDAITHLEQALPIVRSLNDQRAEARAFGNLGIAYKALGSYGKAITAHRQAGKLMLALGDRQSLGQILLNLGNTFEAVGDYDNAQASYEQSLKIAQQLGDRNREGMALANLGAIAANRGQYQTAITTFEQSLKLGRATGDRASEASVLVNLGSAYHALKQPQQAIRYYQESLTLAQQTHQRRRQAEALGSLGLVYADLKDYAKAIQVQRQGLEMARSLADPDLQGIALNNLGHTLFNAGKLAEAETVLLEAVKLLDALRPGLSDRYQVSIFDTQVHTYNLLQQVRIAANHPEGALEAAEWNRARAFTELLAKRIHPTPHTVRLGTHAEAPLSTPAPINIKTIQQIAREQNATLVEYAIVPDDDFKFRGKQRGRESELFIWVVQPSGQVAFRRVDLKPLWQQNATLTEVVKVARCHGPIVTCGPVAQAIRGLGVVGTDAVPPGSTPPDSSKPVRKQAGLRKLYDLLIQPIAEFLPQDPNAHIIFIPQESLFLVPFAALQNAEGKYLIERHTILTAPAIQVLALTHQQRQQQRKGVGNRQWGVGRALIVGNPTMPMVSLSPGEPPRQLSPLPGAEQEAQQIANQLQTKALIGNAATKGAVMQQMPNARLIHLATHGLLEYGSDAGHVSLQGLGIPGAIALAPSQKPLSPTPASRSPLPHDGLLTADEIVSLNLAAELVVLSACDTGQGRITGDGVIGLSRAFIGAGVPSVIVSLWAVPDAPTAQLMTTFYRNLQTTPDKAIALRQAMLSTLKDYPKPLDWAAFTLVGEAE